MWRSVRNKGSYSKAVRNLEKEETQKIQMAYTFIPFRFSNCVYAGGGNYFRRRSFILTS